MSLGIQEAGPQAHLAPLRPVASRARARRSRARCWGLPALGRSAWAREAVNSTHAPPTRCQRAARALLRGGRWPERANATLATAAGTTVNYPPLGSPAVGVSGAAGGLPPGASASVTLQFNNPTNAAITYAPRAIQGAAQP